MLTVMEMMASLIMAQSQVERLEAVLGLSGDDAATLLAVATAKAPSSVAQLAHRINFPQPRAARAVRNLVQRGLVEVYPDPLNRRQFKVCLTPAGGAFLEALPATGGQAGSRPAATVAREAG